jgi:GAF domain-containing protein/HAMP domain-containing protein
MEEEPTPPRPLDRPSQLPAGDESSAGRAEPASKVIVTQVARISAIAEVVTVALYLYLFSRTQAWQMAAAAGLAAVALLGSLAAPLLAGRKPRTARVILLFLFVLAYSSGEWIFSDLTLPLAITGIAAILALGSFLFPGRFWIWLGAGALFVGNITAARSFQLFDRYRLLRYSPINPYVPFATIALIVLVATVWQAVRTLRSGTIRARLLVSFVGMTLLVAAVISVGAILGAFFAGQQRTEAQLESVAVLKEQEIEAWLRGLQTDLSLALAGDGMIDLATAVLNGTAAQATSDAVLATLERIGSQSGRFEEISLLDTQGRVVLATETTEVGSVRSNQVYFREGLRAPYVQRPYYSSSQMRSTVMAARPIWNPAGTAVGVITGRASMGALNEIMAERTGLGQTGETYLVGVDYTLLTPTRFGDRQVYIGTEGVVGAIGTKASGSGLYDNYRAEPVVGAYRWIPGLQVALLAEQEQSEALRVVYLLLGLIGGVALLSALLAVGASLAITQGISIPLANLADTATRIAAGELDLTPQVERQDEIGALAGALAAMTVQVRELIHDLERRVTLRTRELEQRSSHLEAAASVGSVVTSILDTNQLIGEVVRQLRDQFGFYYVGLFLVEPGTDWATLRAGTGEAGQTMIERGHRIRLGTGMVGWTIAHGVPRIMLEAGDDALQLSTPELPETRSEAAIPLRSRGRVLGAFSIQDDKPGRFDHDLLAILSTVADQVAVALDNAELFAARHATLEAQHRAFGELSHQDWLHLAKSRPDWGFRYADQALTVAEGDWEPELVQALQDGALVKTDKEGAPTLSIPLMTRGNRIGAVGFRRHRGEPEWSNEEIELLEGLVEQLGEALENARLQQQARTRAVREQLVADVAAQLRRSLDVETVLRTAADRIRDVLELPEVTVRLAPEAAHRLGGNGHSRTEKGS